MKLYNKLLLHCPHCLLLLLYCFSSFFFFRSQSHKNFLTGVMKSLSSSNKALCEASVVCGTELFMACTYVSDQSSQVFRYFVTQMQGQLQVSDGPVTLVHLCVLYMATQPACQVTCTGYVGMYYGCTLLHIFNDQMNVPLFLIWCLKWIISGRKCLETLRAECFCSLQGSVQGQSD